MGCLVRDARDGDVERVGAIYGHYVRTSAATFEIEEPTAAEMRERLRAVQAWGLPYLVAEVDGVVRGFASVSAFRSRPAYSQTVEDTVYVDAEFAGRGLGTALLRALLERCRAAGLAQVVAVIGGENPGSVALHARAGFRHVGVLRRVGRKFGAWQDVLLMQKELGDGQEPRDG